MVCHWLWIVGTLSLEDLKSKICNSWEKLKLAVKIIRSMNNRYLEHRWFYNNCVILGNVIGLNKFAEYAEVHVYGYREIYIVATGSGSLNISFCEIKLNYKIFWNEFSVTQSKLGSLFLGWKRLQIFPLSLKNCLLELFCAPYVRLRTAAETVTSPTRTQNQCSNFVHYWLHHSKWNKRLSWSVNIHNYLHYLSVI